MKTKIIMIIALAAAFSTAQAHRLDVLAFAEGDTLTINSYFADGTPCKDCSFKVTDGKGAVFAEGKLADDGTYTKNAKLPASLDVVVDAGLGHRSEQKLSVQGGRQDSGKSGKTDVGKASDSGTASADSGEIRKIVREELTRQTAEITAAIDKNNSMSGKIIAGIGYVLGIFGLMALFRKK